MQPSPLLLLQGFQWHLLDDWLFLKSNSVDTLKYKTRIQIPFSDLLHSMQLWRAKGMHMEVQNQDNSEV